MAVLGYQRGIFSALLYVLYKKAWPTGPFIYYIMFLEHYKGAYINYIYNSSALKYLFYRLNYRELKILKYRSNSLSYINV